ncbi:MAG TPA: NAD-dependent epimerase/dehydratase family protein [Pseudonocardiaceae bacterium]|jgi:nucleoside-diphosphate-sugar epimerase|nr:NAD-dependent epimerase/dehydratase family protein [Pseudonocardiaceae bacterium]
MSALSVLFLGGNGMISSACAAEAIERDIDLTVLTRGAGTRTLPEQVRRINVDVHDPAALRETLAGKDFDVVVNFVGYQPHDVTIDTETFAGRTGQYVFISTASVYSRPIAQLPIVESTPRRNNGWPYPRDKIACEEVLETAYRERDFPATVVRPSHTYDRTTVPILGGWTVVERMRQGKPVVVHGDGTSLWTLMHASDFARAFVPLLGNSHTLGDSVHITSDEILTWDQIHLIMARAAGVTPKLVHRSSEIVGIDIPDWAAVLTHDFAHSLLFDNTKLRSFVPGFAAAIPFDRGAREILAYHDADPDRRRISVELDAAFDRLAV